MPIPDDLLDAIAAAIGPAIAPSLTTASATSDLFEAYVFSILVDAAIAEGGRISFRDPADNPATHFCFRTSPGYLWSRTKPYTFALIQFPGVESLEAHLGVRVSGKSGVLHEFDVCMLLRSEAETSRRDVVHPRSSKVLVGIECKFYTSALSLGLGRAFLGLGADVTAKNTLLVTNVQSPSVEKLLSARDRKWEHRITPGAPVKVERLRNELQSALKYYKAR